jgi:hypothetical protein
VRCAHRNDISRIQRVDCARHWEQGDTCALQPVNRTSTRPWEV